MENDRCCNENQIMKLKQAYIVILLWLLLWLLNTPYSICDIYMEEEINIYSTSPSTEIETAS